MNVKRNNVIWVITLLILAMLLFACSREEATPTAAPEEPTPVQEVQAEPTEAPEVAEPVGEQPQISQPIYRWGEVADRLWVLVAYGDAANPTVLEEGTVITAVFSSVEPTVGGSSGCNNYFAGYESTDEGGLTINGPVGQTMMFCEAGMDQETAFLTALESVSSWRISDIGLLVLAYESDEVVEQNLIFAPAQEPLVGHTWRLVSYGDPDDPTPVEEGTSVTAEFLPETDTTGTVGGSATCNSYSTGYTIDGDQISFGLIAGTLMMCPVGADQETAYLSALGTAQTYQIAGPNMQIVYDGGVLNYTSLNLPLTNVLWQAIQVAGEQVPEGVEITALFTPGEEAGMGSVGGSAGCNSYSTAYETSTDISTNPPTHSLTISSPMAMTLAICPDEGLAAMEQAYLAALETAEGYEIHGDELILQTGSGDIVYAADREPLVGTLWSLVSLGDINDPQPPVEGSNFTAQFSHLPTLPSGTVVGQTGCNDYNATYTSNLTQIKINLPMKTDNEDCPWGTGNFEVEQQFFLALNAASEYRILGNVLQIPYGEEESKQVLNFEATQPVVEEVLDLTPLANTFWYLLSIGDNSLIPYTEITAGFEVNEDGVTGLISGSSGCNAYNAAIGENFAVGPVASTQRACPNVVMEQEGGYLDWLSKAYNYTRAGDQLLISTGNGVLTYNSTPVQNQTRELQGATWYLVSVGNLTAVEGSNASVSFNSDGSSLSGNTGCNSFNGRYNTQPGNLLTISGFAATQAACVSDALTNQEQAMLAFLPSATGYLVVGTSMQIETVDGSVINFTSVPPVQPVPPTAVINGPQGIDLGQPVTFDGSGSTRGSLPIVSYQWDMGNGAVLSGATVQYSYDTASSYNVTLVVTDQGGNTGTATLPIQVYPVVEVTPPTAAIEGPRTAFVGESVTFSAAGSTQGTAAITSYVWNSGDGYDSGHIPDNSFSAIYSKPGTYYVSVTVVDQSGLTDTASQPININATLEGNDWYLSGVIPGTNILLQFKNGNVKGFGGCNNYNGKYTTTLAAGPSNAIMIGPLSNSQRACSEDIMAQEQAYLANLQTAASYTIAGNTLIMTLADGTEYNFYAAAPPVATPF